MMPVQWLPIIIAAKVAHCSSDFIPVRLGKPNLAAGQNAELRYHPVVGSPHFPNREKTRIYIDEKPRGRSILQLCCQLKISVLNYVKPDAPKFERHNWALSSEMDDTERRRVSRRCLYVIWALYLLLASFILLKSCSLEYGRTSPAEHGMRDFEIP